MAFNGTGTFVRIYSWLTDQAAGILVRADRMDTDTNDIAAGLSNCMTRDGQSPPTSDIPMGAKKLTGLANGTAAQDATTVLQVFTSPTFSDPVFTGNVSAAGATSFLVPTATAGDNTTKAASTAFVNGVAMTAALPTQSLGFLSSTGTVASFTKSLTFGLNLSRATVAGHATTADIWGALGNQIDWTGTLTTTIFPNAPQAGAERVLICADACSFTAGANMLIDGVASGSTVTCAANDQVIVRAVSTTQFKLSRIKYNGMSQVSSVPIGAEMVWPTETVPTGWLEENGASLLRTGTYAALFAVIGTVYGTADGSHFNLPDARGRFVRGWDHGAGVDPDRATRTADATAGATMTAGDHVGTLQADGFKAHVHSARTGTFGVGGGPGNASGGDGDSGSTGGNETRPINTNRMMIIKY